MRELELHRVRVADASHNGELFAVRAPVGSDGTLEKFAGGAARERRARQRARCEERTEAGRVQRNSHLTGR